MCRMKAPTKPTPKDNLALALVCVWVGMVCGALAVHLLSGPKSKDIRQLEIENDDLRRAVAACKAKHYQPEIEQAYWVRSGR